MFDKVLIANRGAIACRIIHTLRRLGIASVAVYSEADRHSLPVAQADEAVCIGPPAATQSYLSIDAVLQAARDTGVEAIHPGYGFLSERPEFAEACEQAGIIFIGPTSQQMRSFGLKHAARALAADLNLPLLPGTGLLASVEEAQEAAGRIGFPVMLKSTAGGGGIGIRLCRDAADLDTAFAAVQRLGTSNFGDSGAFLERYIEQARHLEVQIFGDGQGKVIAIGERDCSAQRRNQKVLEETPAPGISEATRARLCAAAVALGQAVHYRSAGTVEFVYDNATEEFFFLEVNTRLQVEHGITEEVTGIDLVEWMTLQASGDLAPLDSLEIISRGHSFEARLYAEDPGRQFQPSSGRLTHVQFPVGTRVETWVEPGTEITPFYDPMVAKLIVRGADRAEALSALQTALSATQLAGIETNLDYLKKVCASEEFAKGEITTSFLGRFRYERAALEVLQGGTQTTVQDYPGRVGYWHVGVPPSGPMDSLAFRLANRLVGNSESAAALEITVSGPELKFGCDAMIALVGADMNSTLDDMSLPLGTAVFVRAGAVLKMGRAGGPGFRSYLAIGGGLSVSPYLGSLSTFMLGHFGGHDGRALRSGDVIHLAAPRQEAAAQTAALPDAVMPVYANAWQIGVLYGPHGAPDFFREEDIEMFFQTEWRVHHQLDRTGIRLIGPKPLWARPDGGEAGLHPSNIHDNAYAIGAIDFTGDMPIILGPDGPSLGGFVCPAVIIDAELWKIGQLRPGDPVRFRAVTYAQAEEMSQRIEASLQTLQSALPALPHTAGMPSEPAILSESQAAEDTPAVVIRADGDRCLLVEFGPNVLDLSLRLRVHLLESYLRGLSLDGIIDITAGVRSLHLHYDTRLLPRQELLDALVAAEQAIPKDSDIVVPSRIVHLPLSWDDPTVRQAMEKYMQSIWPEAPWCPDNIEFIRRINGLATREEVSQTVFGASYLVMGLGDVYLGAPVATPLDPRHRLVTTKYNPARTWTPENAVGIGGAYLCIYGMEGPGGYQLCGRTVQIWNTYKNAQNFEPGAPWLLQTFDQIRFYPVSAAELTEMRDGFLHGASSLTIEPTEFRANEYQSFLETIQPEIKAARARQQEAFNAERARWAASGQAAAFASVSMTDEAAQDNAEIPEGCEAVASPMTASVWKVLVEPGQRVDQDTALLVLEAMKTESVILSPVAGVVEQLHARPDSLVMQGQTLLTIRTG